MSGDKSDLIKYRIERAEETYEVASILADHDKWNSAINRLYYAAYYAISALLLKHKLTPTTHNGVKAVFSEKFIKAGLFSKNTGKIYSQLFTWRHKGDYDDLFDFDQEKVIPYFKPVEELISLVKQEINNESAK